VDDIRSLFAARVSSGELDTLGELLGRLLAGSDERDDACAID
jgi:hypothetical protein